MRVTAVLVVVLCSIAASPWSFADEVPFARHEVNAESTYSAAAAIDVNGDGRLDIVSGGWWYEAPTWKKHFVRDVTMIRGRYDDYSHLPFDVNADGKVDYISANYRSRSIYWVANPGTADKPWAKHVVAEPGSMETAILADVDGDGDMDLLPNGTKFAAWWSIEPGAEPRFTRHDFRIEIAGHGLGFGDVNGDGRSDVIGPRGWLEAPEDRFKGRWHYHREFTLDRDCSVPILVADIDGDGDNDLVWGRGHNFGLNWLERGTAEDGTRTWQRHTIDTSWSQPHCIRLADIDNDGRQDLVAGKRYMAHDGRDPGGYDPLVVCWYKFHPESKSWSRHDITRGGTAGFGLDSRVIDLDGDGDLDVLGPGRSGLFWYENLLVRGKDSPAALVVPDAPVYTDHKSVMNVRHGESDPEPVETPFDLALRREHILSGMEQAMGPLPGSRRRVPLNMRLVSEEQTPKYVRQRIEFTPEPGDRVPAHLLLPNELDGRTAAMLCLHQTTSIGKGEPAGLGGKPELHYAHELANRGYVCLVPDYPSFGDYDYDFQKHSGLYASGSMKAIWNNHRAVDLLESLPEVNSDRIGVIGHSLGGHNALFTAAFDQRLKAVVTSCGFTPFHDYYEGRIKGWTSDRYMPRLRDVYELDPDRVPFDFYEVLAAIAPRGIYINAPINDSNFDVGGVKKCVAEVRKAYTLRKAADQLVVEYPDAGHSFPYKVRERAYKWLDEVLK